MKIITNDEAALSLPCEPCRDVQEGLAIARKLRSALQKANKAATAAHRKSVRLKEWDKEAPEPSLIQGIGLSANQIGIRKAVCVIEMDGYSLVLVNPKVLRASPETFDFEELCLSFPGRRFATQRHIWVEVTALNHNEVLRFDVNSPRGLLKAVAVSHEIGHLQGKLPSEMIEAGE